MKVAFWSILAAGFVGCSVFGIGPVLQRMGGNWLSMPMIAGTVLGLAIVALAVMFAMGVRPGVLDNDAAMLALLVALIGVKVVVGMLAMGA